MNTRQAGLTLIEQLKTEVRRCDGCSLEIRHPFAERCPRCYSRLPKREVACGGCLHKARCPVAAESAVAQS